MGKREDKVAETAGEVAKSKHKLPEAKDAIMLFRIELYG